MTMLFFDTDTDHMELYEKICRCGHKMSYHANVMGTGYFSVSQCCFCECKEFEVANEEKCEITPK